MSELDNCPQCELDNELDEVNRRIQRIRQVAEYSVETLSHKIPVSLQAEYGMLLGRRKTLLDRLEESLK